MERNQTSLVSENYLRKTKRKETNMTFPDIMDKVKGYWSPVKSKWSMLSKRGKMLVSFVGAVVVLSIINWIF